MDIPATLLLVAGISIYATSIFPRTFAGIVFTFVIIWNIMKEKAETEFRHEKD